MMVSNPLELYTFYFGWREYDVIWQTAIDTGLAWVPFLGLFIENLTKPFESEFGNGTETSFRRVMIEFLLMCMVIFVCVAPSITLETSSVTYQPACSTTAVQSTVGNSGTTYDNAFGSEMSTTVKVPLFYEIVMGFASGFTNALIVGTVPCDPNLSDILNTINTSQIPNALQPEIANFNNTCYLAAKSMLNAQDPDPSTYSETLKEYGGDSDLNWMGSHMLTQLYYSQLSATTPVKGFPYAQFQSVAINDAVQKGEMEQPEWGYPTCEEWWSDPTYGLEHRVSQAVQAQSTQNPHAGEPSLVDQVTAWQNQVSQRFGTQLSADDIITRGALYNNPNNVGGFAPNQVDVDTDSGISGALAKPFVEAGQMWNEVSKNGFQRDALSDVLPIIQAMTIFLFLFFLSLIHIFGRYRLGTCVSAAFVFFSLIFTNYIWQMLNYLENALLSSISNPHSISSFGQHSTLSNFLTILYLGAPVFFISIMSLAGIKVGQGLNGMFGSGDSFSKQAGDAGRSAAMSAAKAAATMIK